MRSTGTAITATRVLSRFPIVAQENEDISAHAFESRGLLHCEMKLGERAPVLHCLNVHLGLFERGRRVADPRAGRPHQRDGAARMRR